MGAYWNRTAGTSGKGVAVSGRRGISCSECSSRRLVGKERGGRIPGVFNRRAKPPNEMDRRADGQVISRRPLSRRLALVWLGMV